MRDPAILAGLMALCLGLLKILEKAIGWAADKVAPKQPSVVELGPKSLDVLYDIKRKAEDTAEIIGRVDHDGTPLVYGPRKEARDILKRLGVLKTNGVDE
jgi:hypothetical protein